MSSKVPWLYKFKYEKRHSSKVTKDKDEVDNSSETSNVSCVPDTDPDIESPEIRDTAKRKPLVISSSDEDSEPSQSLIKRSKKRLPTFSDEENGSGEDCKVLSPVIKPPARKKKRILSSDGESSDDNEDKTKINGHGINCEEKNPGGLDFYLEAFPNYTKKQIEEAVDKAGSDGDAFSILRSMKPKNGGDILSPVKKSHKKRKRILSSEGDSSDDDSVKITEVTKNDESVTEKLSFLLGAFTNHSKEQIREALKNADDVLEEAVAILQSTAPLNNEKKTPKSLKDQMDDLKKEKFSTSKFYKSSEGQGTSKHKSKKKKMCSRLMRMII